MKNYKSIIALVAAGLACTAVSSQASIVLSGTSYLTQPSSAQPDLQVVYSVDFDSIGDIYTYVYDLTVGTYDGTTFTATTSNPVESFTVDASYVITGSGTSTVGGTTINIQPQYITWNYLGAGANVDDVTYQSDYGPTFGSAHGNDGSPNVTWSTENPGAESVPVPVPEASTIMAGALMLMPFGIGALRSMRKDRNA